MMDSNATDEQLLSAFVDGDREALGELAGRHEQALLGLARGLLGGQSAAALDAVQETWMRVIRYGNSFNGRSSVKTWLYRIAVNRCRDLRVTRQLAVGAAESNHTTDQASDGASMRQEVSEILRDAVGDLSSEQREILLLCYHEGLTHAQAAEVLEIPVGTLKSRLHSGLKELRERLLDEPVR